MVVYFDSVIVIYLIDHTGPFHVRAVTRLASLVAGGDRIAVSDLTRRECRVKPMQNGNAVNFKLVDALHPAAAVEARCDRFLTNDARLARFPDVAVEVLP